MGGEGKRAVVQGLVTSNSVKKLKQLMSILRNHCWAPKTYLNLITNFHVIAIDSNVCKAHILYFESFLS